MVHPLVPCIHIEDRAGSAKPDPMYMSMRNSFFLLKERRKSEKPNVAVIAGGN